MKIRWAWTSVRNWSAQREDRWHFSAVPQRVVSGKGGCLFCIRGAVLLLERQCLLCERLEERFCYDEVVGVPQDDPLEGRRLQDERPAEEGVEALVHDEEANLWAFISEHEEECTHHDEVALIVHGALEEEVLLQVRGRHQWYE